MKIIITSLCYIIMIIGTKCLVCTYRMLLALISEVVHYQFEIQAISNSQFLAFVAIPHVYIAIVKSPRRLCGYDGKNQGSNQTAKRK